MKGEAFKKFLGFRRRRHGIYDVAKSLVDQKRYSDAGDAFFFLTQLALK